LRPSRASRCANTAGHCAPSSDDPFLSPKVNKPSRRPDNASFSATSVLDPFAATSAI
jgi:hypothetical protein